MFRFSTSRLKGALFVRCGCLVLGSLGCLRLVSACSGNDTVTIMEPGRSGPQTASAGSGGTAGAENQNSNNNEPVYVVFSTVDTPDGRSSYYALTSSIDGDFPVDITGGLELPGYASMFAPPDGGYLLSGGEAPTVTKYTLGDDNQLLKGATLSFANLGLDYVYKMVFVDSSKAYILDEGQLQLVSFNPSTMELGAAISIDDFECEDGSTSFGFPVVRDDGLYVTKSCNNDAATTPPGSTLVHVNTSTDEVTVTQDSRCMGMRVSLLADNGDAYWFSDSWASVVWSVSEVEGPRDCGLRVLAGESTFDPNWELDVTSRTGGLSAFASAPASDSTIWLKVFEESAMTETVPVPVDDADYALPVWRWALLDVASDEPVVPDTDANLVSWYGDAIVTNGRNFIPASNLTYTETTLVELISSGFADRMTVQGELRNIVQLR